MKSKTFWNLEKLKNVGEKLYDFKISYDNVKSENLRNETDIYLQCKVCRFEWITNIYRHINLKSGCPWCLNEGKYIRKYNVNMMENISSRIHHKKYYFDLNDKSKIYKCDDVIQIYCGINNHLPFFERLGKVFSRAKNKKNKMKGCLECGRNGNEKEKKENNRWHHNLELLIRKGKEVHGDIYNYDENIQEDILNNRSIIKIQCRRVLDDENVCGAYFYQSIHDHIDSSTGCVKCFKSYRITYDIFIEKFKNLYGDLFILQNVKESDIMNNRSKPYIVCAKCNYIINSTDVSRWLTGTRQCNACINNQPWTIERLEEAIKVKEKEGCFTYENINISDTITGKTEILITCLKCKNRMNIMKNYTFNQTIINHFTLDHGCPRCGGKLSWCRERLLNECEEKEKKEKYDYSLINFSIDINHETIIEIICKNCKNNGYKNFTFFQSVSTHFVNDYGCKRCSKNLKWDYSRFLEEKEKFLKLFPEKYSYENVTKCIFENSHYATEIPIICLKCNNVFKRSLMEHFVNMKDCTFCPKSIISKKIEICLTKINIDFIEEKRIMGPEGNLYRYDYFFIYNGRFIIIEADGKQHFEFTKTWNKTVSNFIKQQERDIYKQYYAFKMGYKMIRIDYNIPLEKIEEHIIAGLNSNSDCYYSTVDIYEWLEVGLKKFNNNNKNESFRSYSK